VAERWVDNITNHILGTNAAPVRFDKKWSFPFEAEYLANDTKMMAHKDLFINKERFICTGGKPLFASHHTPSTVEIMTTLQHSRINYFGLSFHSGSPRNAK
jgi:hypothetical protein